MRHFNFEDTILGPSSVKLRDVTIPEQITTDNASYVELDGVVIGGTLGIRDGCTAPSAVPGMAFVYVDQADGDLKIRFGDGTTKTIVTDS